LLVDSAGCKFCVKRRRGDVMDWRCSLRTKTTSCTAFHWSQAVWRKLTQLELSAAYRQHDTVHRFCRRIISLPFLPADDIQTALQTLRGRATSDKLVGLVTRPTSLSLVATWKNSGSCSPCGLPARGRSFVCCFYIMHGY
jgi:hypothetical protein